MSIYGTVVSGAAMVYAAPGVARLAAGYAVRRTLGLAVDVLTADVDTFVREEAQRIRDEEAHARTANRFYTFQSATSEVADWLASLPGDSRLEWPYRQVELDPVQRSRRSRAYQVRQRRLRLSLWARSTDQKVWYTSLPDDIRDAFDKCVAEEYPGNEHAPKHFRWFARLQRAGIAPCAWGSEYPTHVSRMAEAGLWEEALAKPVPRSYRPGEENSQIEGGMFGDGTPPAKTESEFWSRLDRNNDPAAYSKALDKVADHSGLTSRLAARLGIGGRLRRRGRVAKALEHLGAATRELVQNSPNNPLPGWWTPDLAGKSDVRLGVAYLLNQLPAATVEGAGALLHPDPAQEGKSWVTIQVSFPTAGETLTVSPQLLAFLASHVAFRPRTVELIASLRSRALHWAKKYDVPWEVVSICLPGTVAAAFMLSPHEKAAVRALGTREAAWAAETSSALQTGDPTLSSGMTRHVSFLCRKWLRADSWLFERGLGAPVLTPVGFASK